MEIEKRKEDVVIDHVVQEEEHVVEENRGWFRADGTLRSNFGDGRRRRRKLKNKRVCCCCCEEDGFMKTCSRKED